MNLMATEVSKFKKFKYRDRIWYLRDLILIKCKAFSSKKTD